MDTTLMTTQADMLKPAIQRRLDRASEHPPLRGDVGLVRQHADTVFSVISGAEAKAQQVQQDRRLSPEGRAEQIRTAQQGAATVLRAESVKARERVRQARANMERRARLPRPQGLTETELQARLANARTDLQQLLQNAKPGSGEISQRLRFYVQQDSSGIGAQLVLNERHPERILFPAMGADAGVDAVDWAERHRGQLLRELAPPEVLAYVDALESGVPQLEQASEIIRHVAESTANGYAPAPAADVAS